MSMMLIQGRNNVVGIDENMNDEINVITVHEAFFLGVNVPETNILLT